MIICLVLVIRRKIFENDGYYEGDGGKCINKGRIVCCWCGFYFYVVEVLVYKWFE